MRANTNRITKAVLGTLIFSLLAVSVGLSSQAIGHQMLFSSAASDSIAVGNWQYDQFDSIILQYSQQYGLDPFTIKGQIMLESAFNQWAQSSQINWACGGTRDLGLMQVNPYCNDINANSLFDPSTNIQVGTSGDARLYQEFGSMDLALQAYNIGASAVAAGQRNWAYSDAVDNYANQFQSEHDALYGSGSGGVQYTVKSGDTLSSIAAKYGVSWQSIATANGIYSPYTIYPGEVLTIPGVSQTYTVQSGDSLYSIGNKFGVSWSSIASANGIYSPYTIYPGEVLTIP